MRSFFENLMLFISAFVPLYVLIVINIVTEILNGNLTFNFLNSFILIMCAVLISLGIFGLLFAIKFNKQKIQKIKIVKKVNITDQHFLGYFSLFVLFAISFDLSKVSMFVVFVGVLTFIGIVYIKNSLYYINPFLNLIGFSFYEITYTRNGEFKEYTAKFFYKGELKINQEYMVKLKNENFCFINKKINKK